MKPKYSTFAMNAVKRNNNGAAEIKSRETIKLNNKYF
jgi:hypothetical protein